MWQSSTRNSTTAATAGSAAATAADATADVPDAGPTSDLRLRRNERGSDVLLSRI